MKDALYRQRKTDNEVKAYFRWLGSIKMLLMKDKQWIEVGSRTTRDVALYPWAIVVVSKLKVD